MNRSPCCFPQPGKEKSRRLLEALAQGAGGESKDGTPAFFGVVGIEAVWRQAREAGRFLYGDNAYFDCARQTSFRFTRNALQATGREAPDWQRLRALCLEIKPWQRSGRHVLVCPQSEHFMREVAAWPEGALGWQRDVLLKLDAHTDRPIVVRHWVRDKAERAKTLHEDLQDCWALVTHSSAAANEAILAGIPVFVTGPCAALAMGSSQLEQIEHPRRPDGREMWAAALAGQQWTVEELMNGTAWRELDSHA